MFSESSESGETGQSGGSNAPVGDLPARQAAYAELVAAILDLRSPASTEAFDRALADAVAAGELAEPLARELRWLQRSSLRDVVEHAAQVLPSTLVAMEGGDGTPPSYGAPRAPESHESASTSEPEQGSTPALDDAHTDSVPDVEVPPSAPVDLTARRLLVAGLRPIGDPPFP